MRDMLPRKPGPSVTDLKKTLKDPHYSNGMNPPSTSPALRSPTTSGGSSPPIQDKALNFKSRSDSPHVLLKNSEASSNCISNLLGNSVSAGTMATTTSSNMTSPISSPGIIPRTKSSPHSKSSKLRRTQSTDQKQKNQLFEFDLPTQHEGQSSSDSHCANNNNSKHRDKSPFSLRQNKEDNSSTTSDLSPNSTITTEDRTGATPSGHNLEELAIEDSILDGMYVDDKVIAEALNDIADVDPDQSDSNQGFSELVGTFQDDELDLERVATSSNLNYTADDLELGRVTNPSNMNYGDFSSTSDAFLYGGNSGMRTSQPGPLEGGRFAGGHRSPSCSTTNVSSSATVTTATCAVSQAVHNLLTSSASSLVTSVSSPTFQHESSVSSASSFNPKFSPPDGSQASNQSGKSHLQEILGITDTIRLQNMSKSIDSVPYKSPTTTSYSTGLKSTTHIASSMPSSMAPPLQHRLPLPYKSSRPHQIYDNPMFNRPILRPGAPYMDSNIPWNRGSPQMRTSPGGQMRSPTFPNFVDTSASPSNVNPMSGLQSTVDSIPAAPIGTSGPGTPVGNMGPPLTSPLDGTPPPGNRTRPSPSLVNDKRCVSVDSSVSTTNSKKSTIKRERTRSADSREEERKETSGPKSKRRKSRSKEDNPSGKKSENKSLARTNSGKGESAGPRYDSALSKMLIKDETNDPYLYIFSTEAANKGAKFIACKNVNDIIMFHRSFVGNCKLSPSSDQILSSSTPAIVQHRSPEIKLEKPDNIQKILPMENHPNFSESVPGINLRETKPPLLTITNNNGLNSNPAVFLSQSESSVTSYNGEQNIPATEELTDEKRRHREDQLDKLHNLRKMYFERDMNDNGQKGPGWQGPPGSFAGPHMEKIRPGMKEGIMTTEMMVGQQISPEHAEWYNLIQDHYKEKRRKQDVNPGEVPSRPPPPYGLNSPRWPGQVERYMERMPSQMDIPSRFQQMGPQAHRPLTRMPQEPRMPGNFIGHRLTGPRGPYPPNTRMHMLDPYMPQHMGPVVVRPPMGARLPPSAMRQPGVHENYPFSEQLMKQASFYNRDFDPNPPMMHDWQGADGTQTLSHMPVSTSPTMGPGGMMNPSSMEMESRLTPDVRIPNTRGFDVGGQYPPDMQRYDMMSGPLGSPTPMPPYTGGSMMEAMARRGEPRPPDLNLHSQIPPRSPMNYHVRAPLPSPNIMTSSIGPRYPNPEQMSHHPQPSPMHVGQPRSPLPSPGMVQYLPMGPSSTGMERPQVMLGGGPHSAGPMSNPSVEWNGPQSNMPGSHTPNTTMMHHMMTSQPGMMSSQPGMMMSQPIMMQSQPGMTSQPNMMQHQHMMRMPSSSSGKPGPSTLSIMMNEMSKFKMPEQSPLYQEAVKDTASPPPLNHEPPPLSHAMVGSMRMSGSSHPPTYDSRMGPPRMGGPQMNENFQGYSPSPLSGPPISGGPNMMMGGNMGPDSMQQPPTGYPGRPTFPEGHIPEFDLRGILPVEKPSQTIQHLPPEANESFPHSNWGGDGIRPQLMSAPMYPIGPPHPNRPLI